MEVKIDTKEKFHVVTLNEADLSDNIAAALSNEISAYLHKDIKNVVLKLPATETITENAAVQLSRLQQKFYDNSASFVICELQPPVESRLDELELLEFMNITPSESEAWDIVQMEEIEREMMEDNDITFNSHGES
ncbi:anti-anti-sigma factor [Segetibacter sp. 3557_3]|uniref:STAS domain-containing protein n=1 Tax=Segetibacter sp. 3557_3 TaxID=2547429 RepID=UPI00105858BA|nr:STAS domain-containing protein [Segetibacter sp. 3557_3]TDH26511.1 anti-anti-sigma factor [Segetibacter sp. 3557_3]